MLYKVTPMMTPSPAKKEANDEAVPKEARKRRKSAVYDHEGNEVLITMMCLKCKAMKPLTMFGLRKMADGAIRNQPWCRTCRSGASSARKKEQREHAADEALVQAHDAEALAVPVAAPMLENLAAPGEPEPVVAAEAQEPATA
ncbi:MAG: hypothetical protein K1X64_08735 [Myxococcaceae bacterium]|nr:hypothetical protein [Myxococcaceae bacterium]